MTRCLISDLKVNYRLVQMLQRKKMREAKIITQSIITDRMIGFGADINLWGKLLGKRIRRLVYVLMVSMIGLIFNAVITLQGYSPFAKSTRDTECDRGMIGQTELIDREVSQR